MKDPRENPTEPFTGVNDKEGVKRLAALRRRFLTAAERWMDHAAGEHEVAKMVRLDERFKQMGGAGSALRAQARAAKAAAERAEAQAAKMYDIAENGPASTKRRGPGRKPKLVEPPKGDDPATAMLKKRAAEKKEKIQQGVDRMNAAKAEKREAAASTALDGETRVVEEPLPAPKAMETCEACGSEMTGDVYEKHAEVCVG